MVVQKYHGITSRMTAEGAHTHNARRTWLLLEVHVVHYDGKYNSNH